MTTPSAPQLEKARHGRGFIAALDQSGGSTPKALLAYGVDEGEYHGDDEMFACVHRMRTRIITDAAFQGDKIIAAILFENTMDRDIDGMPSARYLWERKNILPILKVDQGLAEERDGVQRMKPMPRLDALLDKAVAQGMFGTKMRSVIKHADSTGIGEVVKQQFEVAQTIIGRGLVPIVEPEVDIHSPQKAAAEGMLREAIGARLDALGDGEFVILKLTLPETADYYADFVRHANCLRVVALSGGYSRTEANRRLTENHGMAASFSRALTEGLSVRQSEAEFTAMLGKSIDSIVAASAT